MPATRRITRQRRPIRIASLTTPYGLQAQATTIVEHTAQKGERSEENTGIQSPGGSHAQVGLSANREQRKKRGGGNATSRPLTVPILHPLRDPSSFEWLVTTATRTNHG